jgi:hypothetical protein
MYIKLLDDDDDDDIARSANSDYIVPSIYTPVWDHELFNAHG